MYQIPAAQPYTPNQPAPAQAMATAQAAYAQPTLAERVAAMQAAGVSLTPEAAAGQHPQYPPAAPTEVRSATPHEQPGATVFRTELPIATPKAKRPKGKPRPGKDETRESPSFLARVAKWEAERSGASTTVAPEEPEEPEAPAGAQEDGDELNEVAASLFPGFDEPPLAQLDLRDIAAEAARRGYTLVPLR